MTPPTRPTDDQLQRFLDGALSGDEEASVRAALASDPALVERVEAWRQTGDAVRLWSQEAPPALPEGFGEQLWARVRAESAPAPANEVSAEAPERSNVVPFARPARRKVAPWVMSAFVPVAVAAVALLALRPSLTPRTVGGLQAVRPQVPVVRPVPVAETGGGSEVLAVDGAATVMEVSGSSAGGSVAVVWIDDTQEMVH